MTPTTMHDGQIMITYGRLVEYQMSQILTLGGNIIFKIISKFGIFIVEHQLSAKLTSIVSDTCPQTFITFPLEITITIVDDAHASLTLT